MPNTGRSNDPFHVAANFATGRGIAAMKTEIKPSQGLFSFAMETCVRDRGLHGKSGTTLLPRKEAPLQTFRTTFKNHPTCSRDRNKFHDGDIT